MTEDIVARLRDPEWHGHWNAMDVLREEFAAEIERLRALLEECEEELGDVVLGSMPRTQARFMSLSSRIRAAFTPAPPAPGDTAS